ncbi:Hsp70 protein-domain-containing protein [Mycena metata]|uniref:Hsp70 protein-domain-containing protein n=1 Tax=Mycena metata TaxID=1033252 RepID=A0AAD7K245_9AGAR|nr:Hsp70 protein-domain-containing protein [Mycena metata]
MPDSLSCGAFLLALTVYGLRIIILVRTAQETPQTPLQWGQTGPIIGLDIGTTSSRVGVITAQRRVVIFRDYDAFRSDVPSTVNGSACTDPHNEPITFLNGKISGATSSASTGQEACMDQDTHSTESESQIRALTAVAEQVRTVAEEFHNSRISQAVIAIPIDYPEDKRRWIRRAALLAGLSPVRLLDESVAVALAYGLDTLRSESYAFVLDVGLVIRASLLHIVDGDIEVISAVQNDTVGGDALNRVLFNHIAKLHRESEGIALDALQTLVLQDQVEMAKITLSSKNDAVVAVPVDDRWTLTPISVANFEDITSNLVDTIVNWAVDETLSRAGLPRRMITHVILTGGSVHIPALRDRVFASFPRVIPLSSRETFPNDAVVYGATIFAQRLARGLVREEDKLYVQNVTPLAFSIETADGSLSTLIYANSPLPATRTRSLDLRSGEVRIFTGGRPSQPKELELIGMITLPRDMNATRIQITLAFSPYGVLNVTAVDRLGRSHSSLIEPRRPYQSEIDQMDANAAEMKLWKENFRGHVASALPVLRRQFHRMGKSHPQRGVRAQIVEAVTALEVWIDEEMMSASENQLVAKLKGGQDSTLATEDPTAILELEVLLRQDIELEKTAASSLRSRFWR